MGWLVVVVSLAALAVVGAIVVYTWRRMVRDPFAPGRPRRTATAVLAGTVVLTFGTIFTSGLTAGSPFAGVAQVGYVMLAVFFYLALALLVLEVPRWAWHRWSGRASIGEDAATDADAGTDAPAGEDTTSTVETAPEAVDLDRRRTVARILAATAGVAAVGTTIYGFLQARRVEVKAVTVPMPRPDPAVDGLRIAVLADIHLTTGLRERSFTAETVATVNELDVDLVVIVGDLVDGSVDELGDDAAPLADLRSTYGSVFVTGNHEYISGAQQWVDFLPTLGVRVLRNESIEIDRNGGTFVLAGVEDVTGESDGHGPDFDAALAGRDPARTVVLLSHQPVLADEAREHGVDLQISGHTHGGQLWPLHHVVQLQQGHLAGLERLGDTVLYTSRGVGSWGPPVRVGAPPEISLLTLRAR